jgi:tetrahydrodipicolinate N-acetyltransferase
MLSPSDRAPQLLMGEGVQIAEGVEIGGSVVIHAGWMTVEIEDVPARAVVVGDPARVIGEVGQENLLERWR